MLTPLTGEPGFIEVVVGIGDGEEAHTFEHPSGQHDPFVRLALTPDHARDLLSVLRMLECLEADPAEAPTPT